MARTPPLRRSGFSLIEVALALVVAAGGMLAIFGVFPISLRQSANSRSDMGELTFASTVLQTLAGNIRTIDRIDVWNDPSKFWNAATTSTSGRRTAARRRPSPRRPPTWPSSGSSRRRTR